MPAIAIIELAVELYHELMEDEMNEINCPHCGKEITGMARILIETSMSNKEMLDWTSPCPHCGKTIHKKDMDDYQDQSKEK